MDVPRENIDMPSQEWKPEQSNGHLKPEEHAALQKLVSRFYDQISKTPLPETPDFSIWFGENQMTISGNLPQADPDTVRVTLAGQALMVRGLFKTLLGSPAPPKSFQKIFMLPYAIDPRTLHVDWMMNFLIIQAKRLRENQHRAA